MKEQLISFETAKLAKEKDFNILQHSYYFEDGEFKENSLKGTNGYYGEEYEFNLSEFNENWNDKWLTKKNGDRCFGCSKQQGYLETFSAPTQSVLQKWLREVYDIHIKLEYFTDNTWDGILIYQNAPYEWDDNTAPVDAENCKTYEEALEICLQKALKLI